MRTAIKIVISVDTRNTGFRYYALKKGRELGVVGTIAYHGDTGGITIHAEAKDSVLQHYVSILRLGTPLCKVISIMTIPDQMLNCVYLNILPTLLPVPGPVAKKVRPRSFRIGLFGF